MVNMIVLTCLMKRTVRTRVVNHGNFSVRMIVAYTVHGNAMETMTVMIALDKLVQTRITVRPSYAQHRLLQL